MSTIHPSISLSLIRADIKAQPRPYWDGHAERTFGQAYGAFAALEGAA